MLIMFFTAREGRPARRQKKIYYERLGLTSTLKEFIRQIQSSKMMYNNVKQKSSSQVIWYFEIWKTAISVGF